MPEILLGRSDTYVKQIKDVLARYEKEHPSAQTSLYRQNSVSIRIRVIDPSFSDLSIGERGQKVWPYLRKLPESVQGDITVLLLLAPEEVSKSFANADFEDPQPSRL